MDGDKEIRLEHYEKIIRTPAVAIGLEGWVALVDAGHCYKDVIMLFWDNGGIVAFDADDPVGVMTYSHQDWSKEIHINIGYVKPAFRKRGIYRLMWSRLLERAKELKVVQITGSTAMENAEMRTTARALGRIERGVELSFEVK